MKVGFADGFFESIENIVTRERWYWKIWDLFRYDIPRFVKNIWRFRKALNRHHWWDGRSSLVFMQIAFKDIADNLETRGNEVDSSRLKKVKSIRRAIELLDHLNNDSYIELAENELGPLIHYDWKFEDVPDKPGFCQLIEQETPEEKIHNSAVYERSRVLETEEWKELLQIIHGQDYTKFTEGDWDDNFDGSGLKGWWD
jgi:hypothetical protein